MKSRTIYKRHPVFYGYIITIFRARKIVRACLICNRPCPTVSLTTGFRRTAYNICLCHQYTILIKPEMLIIKAYFYVTSGKIITAISLHGAYAVNRITTDLTSTRNIFQKLLQFPILIDLKSIFIIGYCHIISIRSMECTGYIDRIIFRCKILYVCLYCILIYTDTVRRYLKP